MKRIKIAHTILIIYDLIILPLRIVRLILEWWNEHIGNALVQYLYYWVKKEEKK